MKDESSGKLRGIERAGCGRVTRISCDIKWDMPLSME